METENFQTKEFDVPKLPITIDPEDPINKIVYFGDKKAKVAERTDEENCRVSSKNKQGIMHYADITKQLTHVDDSDNDRWEIEDILDCRWGIGPMKKKLEIQIKWKGYEDPAWEPLSIIKEDDPITLANNAKDHNGDGFG